MLAGLGLSEPEAVATGHGTQLKLRATRAEDVAQRDGFADILTWRPDAATQVQTQMSSAGFRGEPRAGRYRSRF